MTSLAGPAVFLRNLEVRDRTLWLLENVRANMPEKPTAPRPADLLAASLGS